MNILYHLTVLPPKMPECEALSQEITALRRRFGGELVYLNPNQHRFMHLPRLAFGFHKLNYLRSLEKNVDIHHIYNPDPFPFPILRFLQRPIIYSISSGISKKRPDLAFFSSLPAIAVPDERSLNQLKYWGLDNVYLVRSGINTRRFSVSPMSLNSEFRLMIASAPWTQGQFKTKGIDALLEAAQQYSQLKLIFLWRGVLVDEMERRVQQRGLEKQVKIINKQVDVNDILREVHATITLAAAPGIVKSYPHSLLDSLAAGKPVLVSRAIPMSDYVEQVGCGQIIEKIIPAEIINAVETLVKNYSSIQSIAQTVGQRDFSEQGMVASFQKVYEQVLQKNSQ